MSMDGCTQCTSNNFQNCNLLKTYSNLCLSMPDMEECNIWKNICNLVPGKYF